MKRSVCKHRVYFVGDRPSRQNLDPDTPFVGTKSYTKLLEWINRLDIDVSRVLVQNSNRLYNLHYLENFKVIALGNMASDFLTGCDIEHFKLPHPSGRNRILNNKKLETAVLRRFIYGKNDVDGIVGIDVQDDAATLYLRDGTEKVLLNEYFILYHELTDWSMHQLKGDNHYKFARKYRSASEYRAQAAKDKAWTYLRSITRLSRSW